MTAVLAAPGAARADEVCMWITVTTFAAGPHTVTPPCVEVPLSLTYDEKYVRFPPWFEVTVGFTPPSDTP